MYPSHLQFGMLLVMQIEISLHAPEIAGYIIHHLIDQFIQIENGRDLLRPFLQLEQMLNLLELDGTGRDGIGDGSSWTRSHGVVTLANL